MTTTTTPVDTTDDPIGEVTESATNLWQDFLDTVPRLGVAIAIIVVGWGVSRLARAVLRRALEPNHTTSFANVMSKLGGWLVLFFFGLAATATAFPSVKPVDLLAGLGFFSVAIGFAFQDILENTLAGVLLLFRQPFRSGDQIEVEGHAGAVEAITIRETRIKTFDGQLIVIPNRDVYKNAIRIQTHYDDRRIAFVAGVAYENEAEEACRVIADSLNTVEGVAAEPAPEALVNELSVSTVNIEARFWCGPQQHESVLVLDRAIKAVKGALDEAGIEMPADIVALQATPSFKAALQNDATVTPGGSIRSSNGSDNTPGRSSNRSPGDTA